MRYLTEGVQTLSFPKEALDDMERAAKSNSVKGKGKFCYVPMDVVCPDDKRVSIVVMLVYQPFVQRHLHTQSGDVIVYLRSEWNVRENPLDEFQIMADDGQHRHPTA
jgi:hypothetical protein